MDRSPPVGLALVVCESVVRNTDDRLSLVGLVNRIVADTFPVTLPELAIYVALTDARPGDKCQIVLVDSSTEAEVQALAEFEVPSMAEAIGTGIIEMDVALRPFPFAFTAAGVYFVRLLGDGEIVLQRPILVEAAVEPSPASTKNNLMPIGMPIDSVEVNPMIEMALLESLKETDKKLCWSAEVGGTDFRLYIPKWRVPEPWPRRITVAIEAVPSVNLNLSSLTCSLVAKDESLRAKPIRAMVHSVAIHSKTIRYAPDGDPVDAEIGEPYIPTPLTLNGAEHLLVTVVWDLKSRGNF